METPADINYEPPHRRTAQHGQRRTQHDRSTHKSLYTSVWSEPGEAGLDNMSLINKTSMPSFGLGRFLTCCKNSSTYDADINFSHML